MMGGDSGRGRKADGAKAVNPAELEMRGRKRGEGVEGCD